MRLLRSCKRALCAPITWSYRIEVNLFSLKVNHDQDGSGRGFDETMIQEIMRRCDVPVIAAGGAGNVNHISQLIQQTGVDAVCLGSILHYSPENKIRRVYKGQPKNISSMTIYEIKSLLNEMDIICRMIN